MNLAPPDEHSATVTLRRVLSRLAYSDYRVLVYEDPIHRALCYLTERGIDREIEALKEATKRGA